MDHPALHRQLQKSAIELLLQPLKGLDRRKEVKAETKLIVRLEKGYKLRKLISWLKFAVETK